MKLVLMKDVENLGITGDEVEVKDGYARNYLIPRGLAVEATPGALRLLEQKKQKRQRLEQKIKEEYEGLAEKLKEVSCTISMETGEDDKHFGSVTSEMVAQSLQQEGIEVDKKKIIMDEPIKSLGVYNIDVRLHPEVKTQVRIWVVKK
ncbi:MAG: 50S ribosomal protein L9 [Candidatus Omnitrophota bacterium]